MARSLPTPGPSDFTPEQIKWLRSIKNGSDIYGYAIAGFLRGLQRSGSDLIQITKPMMYTGDGTDQMPHFGAVLTDQGRAFLKAHSKRAKGEK